MMTKRLYILILIVCMAINGQAQEAAAPAEAQERVLTEEQVLAIADELNNFMGEVSSITNSISTTKAPGMKMLEHRLIAVNVRWQSYTTLRQQDIASTPALMDMLSQYQMMYMTATDSIAAQTKRVEAQGVVNSAIMSIRQMNPKYEKMLNKATTLSLAPQTATQLEALKAEEQVIFQKLTEDYQKAQAAIELDPKLESRKRELDKVYIGIKAKSEKIQAAVYKSLLERLKDYVLTFAGVAILIMFVSMIYSKMSALKQAADAAKKLRKINNPSDYPTI